MQSKSRMHLLPKQRDVGRLNILKVGFELKQLPIGRLAQSEFWPAL